MEYFLRMEIFNDDIKVDDKEYPGTPGLWGLIMLDNPQEFTEEDYENYRDLLIQTNTIYQKNDPNRNKPKSSKSEKWKKLISPIWDYIKKKEDEDDPQPSTSGEGLKILPSDPNALIDRFDLLPVKRLGIPG